MPGHKAKRLGTAAPPNGSWEPFKPGNAVGVVHGASTERLWSPLAGIIQRDYLSMEGCDYLRWPVFAGALRALCEAEAQEFLYLTWMEELPGDGKYHAVGAQQPPVATWGQMQERSAARRKDCGLTPLTNVRIRKVLASAALDVARLVADAARDGNWDDGGAED